MDDLEPPGARALQDVIRAQQAITEQRLTIDRLLASKLDVSWAEMNLREMNDHLKLVQNNLDSLETIKPSAIV